MAKKIFQVLKMTTTWVPNNRETLLTAQKNTQKIQTQKWTFHLLNMREKMKFL